MPPLQIGDAELRAISELVRAKIGIQLGAQKRNFVIARLASRLRALGYESFARYHEHLSTQDPEGQELRLMLNRLTTNKTSFFRERHHFDFVRERLIPELLRLGQQKLRLWSAACSTGQEAYSLAMLLASDERLRGWDMRILASDVDTDVLAEAEAGQYQEDDLAEVPEDWRARYFEHRGSSFSVRRELRELVTFRHINLMQESWPIHVRFDTIFCRNVLIYFDAATQARLCERLAAQLEPHGKLFVGHSEILHALAHVFTLVGGTVYCLASACGPGGRPRGGSWRPRRGSGQPPRWRAGPELGAARTSLPAALPEVSLRAGDVHVSARPCLLRTILGSCVAVCLFDPGNRVGGMNHFLLAEGEPGDALATQYGAQAMDALLRELEALSASRSRLRAKLFGGARVLSGLPQGEEAAEANVRFARAFLEQQGIPIAAERLGGEEPICLLFETHTGRAFVRVVTPAEPAAAAARAEEQRYRQELKQRWRAAPPQSQAP
jgi:chemotaxis protein methyltransferase CheR